MNWFSVTTIVSILLVASSRGALGGLFLATLVLAIITLKHFSTWKAANNKKQYLTPTILVLSALTFSFITYNILPYHFRDLARVSATAGQTISGSGKIKLTPNVAQPPWVDLWVNASPFLGERTPIFAATTAMTLDAPLLGQGTGNFAWVYPSYSNRYPDFRDPLSSVRTFTTNPHNVLLQIASQNGIPAMLLFLGLLLFFWWKLFQSTWHNWSAWHMSGLAAITAAIFDSMFNHVFFNPASLFTFALLGGVWWGSLNIKSKYTIPAAPKIFSILSVISISLLCIWPIRWGVSEWYTGQAMAYAKYPSYEASFYSKAYNWDKENFRAAFGMGQVAYKQKKYKESAHYFEAFEQFYPYNPPALNMQGAAYMMQGEFQNAIDTFERALKIYPGFEMVEQNLNRARAMMAQHQRRLTHQQP
ncbi:MAG: O-antigen ligase family protein [Ghiorsea sp.]